MKRIRILGAVIALTLPLIGGPAILSAPAYAVTCLPGTATPTDSYPGTVVMANNFESGTLNGFTVQTGGDGTASVSSAQAHDGACSAYLHVTSNSGSLANFSTALPSGTREVYADGWFNITTAGLSTSNVPYFRFFNGSTRFVDTFRDNSNGQVWLRVLAPDGTFTYTRLVSSTVSLSAWHRVAMHVIPNGGATTVEVWFDGTQVYSSSQVNTAISSVTRVQNGSEHNQQMGDEYIDGLIIKSVGASAAPVASFTASPTSGTAPLNVAFTDTSTGSPTAWSWNFGDGSTSTVQNPTHTYANAGTYTATLTATNAGGSSSSSKTITVNPTSSQGPVASFTANPTSGAAPLNVAFTDTSTGSPTSWSWAFGDGATSTAQNPTHTYATPGTYTATLTATNASGSNSTSKTITVNKAQPTAGTAQDVIPNDNFTLTGGLNPTGTVTFNLYPPSDTTCSQTPALTQTVSVTSGNGTYGTSNTTFHSTTAGTWRWASSYSGDANNQAVSSACGAETFTITNG